MPVSAGGVVGAMGFLGPGPRGFFGSGAGLVGGGSAGALIGRATGNEAGSTPGASLITGVPVTMGGVITTWPVATGTVSVGGGSAGGDIVCDLLVPRAAMNIPVPRSAITPRPATIADMGRRARVGGG